MKWSGKRVLALCLLLAVPAVAHAQSRQGEARGELLYATHCRACHAEQVHWRENRRATDWNSLVAEVRRWQTNIGLLWSEGEIEDTARYLNTVYYRFPVTGAKNAVGAY